MAIRRHRARRLIATYSGAVAHRNAAAAARTFENSTPLRIAARLGYVVNGFIHVVIGVIAIAVGLGNHGAGGSGSGGGGGGEADQSGALGSLAAVPGGAVLLWVSVVGLAALGLWQLLRAFLIQAPDPTRRWGRRISDFGKAAAYLALAFTAFSFARGGTANSASSSRQASAQLLATAGGSVILAVIGVAVVIIGAYFVYKGARRRFLDDLSAPSGMIGSGITVLGVVGYIAKGLVLMVVGVLVVVAVITHDPQDSSGIDGALKALASVSFGPVILLGLGIGLIVFGLYCAARARYARL
jgi:Domain of Unknown Function (DUF1206).